jgi:RNA polymerase sigma-70 factor (ECF subfamily)
VLLEEGDMERLEAGYERGPEEKLLEEEKAKLIREVLSSYYNVFMVNIPYSQ